MASVIKKTAPYTYHPSVNTPDYPEADWLRNPDLSGVAGVPQKLWKVDAGAVVPYPEPEQLAVLKPEKIAAIEAKTASLIGGGFEYPAASGTMYSLGVDARIEIIAMKQAKANELSYPVPFTSQDGTVNASLANAAEVDTFYATAFGRYQAIKAAGGLLKAQVAAATTIAELDAVVDNRT